MELRDLIVTPIVIFVVFAGAYFIRPCVTDNITRRYFLPALTVRIIGALTVGFIYQFYYNGGDTISFHTYGSRHIWEAFVDDPINGIQLLFSDGVHHPSTYQYSSKIWFFRDPQSFFVVRVAALFDLFTFSSYSATAVLFGVVGFVGAWSLFVTFYHLYHTLHKWIAFSCLFVPTVFFWGSGIFKDTLTLAALEMTVFFVFKVFVERKVSVWYTANIIFFCWIIYTIKIYILLTFLPAIILWFFSKYIKSVRVLMLRVMITPFVFGAAIVLGYLTVQQVAKEDTRYKLDRIAETAMITAYDIRYGWGARTGEGSGYTLGELDGSFGSVVRLAPQAIIVSLYRPYLWEVHNPLMLLSSIEGLMLIVITIFVFVKTRSAGLKTIGQPEVLFCMIFSLVFAFAVGVSTYNFGTLSRYKIPVIPFYLLGIGLIYYHSKRSRKLLAFDETE